MSIAAGARVWCQRVPPWQHRNIRYARDIRFRLEMREQNEEYPRPAQPPDTSSLATVREAAAYCTACYLYKRGTQTVFGEGPKRAAMVLVGEQPGDYEDVAGKTFVVAPGKNLSGPA